MGLGVFGGCRSRVDVLSGSKLLIPDFGFSFDLLPAMFTLLISTTESSESTTNSALSEDFTGFVFFAFDAAGLVDATVDFDILDPDRATSDSYIYACYLLCTEELFYPHVRVENPKYFLWLDVISAISIVP